MCGKHFTDVPFISCLCGFSLLWIELVLKKGVRVYHELCREIATLTRADVFTERLH
jgi:hypothetical protein